MSWPDGAATRHPEEEFASGHMVELGDSKLCNSSCVQVQETGLVDIRANGDVYVDGDLVQSLCQQPQAEMNPPLAVEPAEPIHWTGESEPAAPAVNPKQAAAEYLATAPEASNSQVIDHLATIDIAVTAPQVAEARESIASAAVANEEPDRLPEFTADPMVGEL